MDIIKPLDPALASNVSMYRSIEVPVKEVEISNRAIPWHPGPLAY